MHIWTTLKIFVSSTFKDLELERDQLAQIFTDIQQQIFSRRLHIIPYDLRWREHSEDNLVKWCLNMVQQCGYFIGILGYRYGWRPPYDYYDQQNTRNISITEMEIEMAQKVIAKNKRIFFFGNEDQYSPQDLQGESSEDRESLQKLKERLQKEGETVFLYNNTQELLTKLGELLQTSIDQEYPPGTKAEFESYDRQDALREIIEEKRRGFVGQKEHLEFFTSFAKNTNKNNYLAIEAVAGTGKSALLAEFIHNWRQKSQIPIIAHYMSMSGDSRSPEGVIHSLGEQLVALGWLQQLEISPQDQQEQVHNTLKNSQKPLIIAIDGIDEMDEEGQSLSWLPQALPTNINVIITTRPTEVWQKLQSFSNIHHYRLPVLQEEDIRQIIQQYRDRVKISLEEENFLVKRASGSPLFLKVSLDEMAAGGIAVGQLAETVDALFHQILKRLQSKYGEKIIADYLGLIAASRNGLMEAELREILYADFHTTIADDFFCSLQKSLANFVIQREKLLAFFHPEFERSVKMWLGKMHLRTSHVRLSKYFENKGYQYERSLSELAYQAQWGEEYTKLLGLFADILFLEQKCASGMLVDLRKDLHFAVTNITVPLPASLQLYLENEGCLDKEGLKIIAKILDLNFHFLLRHPESLTQCLWNYGYWYDAPSAAQHYTDECETTSSFYKVADWWRQVKEKQGDWIWIETLRPLPEPLDSATEKIFRGHEHMVSCVRFNKEENKIISCSVDETIRLWDIESGECLQKYTGHTNYVSGICFVDNDSKIASSSGDNTIKVWDAKTGTCLQTITGHENHVSAINSDNDKLIVSGSKDKNVRLWNLETGECIRIFKGHSKTINSVLINKSKTKIVSGAWDNTIRIWDIATGECLRVLEGHEDDVKSVCMTDDESKIFSASKDFTARIWDANSGECLHILQHKSAVFNLACSEDGLLLTTAAFGTIRNWDTETGECVFKSHGHESAIFAIAMSRNGNHIISGSSDRTIRLWDTNKQADRMPEGHIDTMQNISLSRKNIAATSSKDGDVRLWNIENGKCVSTIKTDEYIRFAHFCLDDKYILTGGENKVLRLWDVTTKELFRSFDGHEKLILCGIVSKDGKYIISGGRDRLAIVWDMASGNILHRLSGHTQAVRSVTISANNELIASGGEDYIIKVWQTSTGECIQTFEGHESGITSLLFKENQLISTCRDNTIKYWCLQTGNCLSSVDGTSNVEQFANSNAYYVAAEQIETQVRLKSSHNKIAFFPSILRHADMNEDNYICAYGGQYTYLLKLHV